MAASGDNSRDSQGGVNGVKTGDSSRLRAIDQAVAWSFRITKDLDSSSERLKPEILLSSLNEVLGELENDADLFFNLLKSDPARMDAVRKAGGYATKY